MPDLFSIYFVSAEIYFEKQVTGNRQFTDKRLSTLFTSKNVAALKLQTSVCEALSPTSGSIHKPII